MSDIYQTTCVVEGVFYCLRELERKREIQRERMREGEKEREKERGKEERAKAVNEEVGSGCLGF